MRDKGLQKKLASSLEQPRGNEVIGADVLQQDSPNNDLSDNELTGYDPLTQPGPPNAVEPSTVESTVRQNWSENLPQSYEQARGYLKDLMWLIDSADKSLQTLLAPHRKKLADMVLQIDRIVPRAYVNAHISPDIIDIEASLRAQGIEIHYTKPALFVESQDHQFIKGQTAVSSAQENHLDYEDRRVLFDSLKHFTESFKEWDRNRPLLSVNGVSPEEVREEKLRRVTWLDQGESISELLIDTRVDMPSKGTYTIERKLASGGMGHVFEARDVQGNTVVLKLSAAYRYEMMHDTNMWAATDFPRVQIREAMALHYLTKTLKKQGDIETDAYIPVPQYIASQQIIDPGSQDEYRGRRGLNDQLKSSILKQYYRSADRFALLVQEKIDGPTLDKILRSAESVDDLNVVSINDAYNFTKQLCQAVKWIHERGVFHRDLKPQNIVYDISAGYLRLVDFGGAIMPDVVELQAERIMAHDIVPVPGGLPAVYAREPRTPIMTPLYVPDYELLDEHYAHGIYSMNLHHLDTVDQKGIINSHASRRDYYSLGMIIYEMLKKADPRISQQRRVLEYISGLLLSQNKDTRKLPDRFTVEDALLILARPEQIDVTDPIVERIAQEGLTIGSNKRNVIKKWRNDLVEKNGNDIVRAGDEPINWKS